MNIGHIYKAIKQKNEETGNRNAWVDVVSNTIWIIGNDETGELIRFYAENGTLADRSEEEINEVVQLALSQDWPEEKEPVTLWVPVR